MISYGLSWIKESADWLKKHPLGPVHWDVWDCKGNQIGEDIPATALPQFLVTRGLLILW